MKIKSWCKNAIGRLRGEIPTEKLVKMGMTVGKNFIRQRDCIIDNSHCFLITMGDNVSLANRVNILAHDASTRPYTGYTKVGIVEIGSNVLVGASSIILPDVRIGNNVIIGVGSVITKDIPDNAVVAGNPAKVICSIEEYISKHSMEGKPIYEKTWTTCYKMTKEQQEQMKRELKSGMGYIE
jgi:maltose O-acetyltransferase